MNRRAALQSLVAIAAAPIAAAFAGDLTSVSYASIDRRTRPGRVILVSQELLEDAAIDLEADYRRVAFNDEFHLWMMEAR